MSCVEGSVTTIGVVVSNGSARNETLIAVASELALSRSSEVLLIGVVHLPAWIRGLAPLGSPQCARELLMAARAEIDNELLRCMALLPVSIASRQACCSGWGDPLLHQLLERHTCAGVVTSLSGNALRRMRRIASGWETTLLVVQPSAAASNLRFDRVPVATS
jgi:hypothetical protein